MTWLDQWLRWIFCRIQRCRNTRCCAKVHRIYSLDFLTYVVVLCSAAQDPRAHSANERNRRNVRSENARVSTTQAFRGLSVPPVHKIAASIVHVQRDSALLFDPRFYRIRRHKLECILASRANVYDYVNPSDYYAAAFSAKKYSALSKNFLSLLVKRKSIFQHIDNFEEVSCILSFRYYTPILIISSNRNWSKETLTNSWLKHFYKMFFNNVRLNIYYYI